MPATSTIPIKSYLPAGRPAGRAGSFEVSPAWQYVYLSLADGLFVILSPSYLLSVNSSQK